MKPICIDLYSGLGGWSEGFLAEGYQCWGFDIERHDYGTGGYPGDLVLQDILTVDGTQFKDAAVIVASPPCQEYSYMAMPWSRAKQIAKALRTGDTEEFPEGYHGSWNVAQLKALFNACIRIQIEASHAAGRYIPMIIENVRGAQPWVGRARAVYGSFLLWGDIAQVATKIMRPDMKGEWLRAPGRVRKVPGFNFHQFEQTGEPGGSFQSAAVKMRDRDGYERTHEAAFGWKIPRTSSKSNSRKAASAQIAKIPLPLSRWVARCFAPQ